LKFKLYFTYIIIDNRSWSWHWKRISDWLCFIRSNNSMLG